MSKWIAEFDLEDGDTMPEHMDLEYKGARIDFHCRPLEQEPTTKNDLGVENDLVSSIVEKISEKVTETHEEFIFETIRPYCEDVVQMKISKRDLEQALLKYYGKNNLGADCVARQDVERFIEGFINEYTPEEELEFINLELDGLKHIPPVTPQEPKTGHCKDCKWWKDSDGKYRRGIGAESQCPLNTHAVYCGDGYCYMFSPNADMRGEEE